MKTISFSLNEASIKAAIKELEAYRSSFESKLAQLVEELARLGIPVINSRMSEADISTDADGTESGSETYHDTEITVEQDGSRATAVLTVSGEKVAFIEFGAGVYYNGSAYSSPHPKGQELGMLIGTYGYGNGQRMTWEYRGADGRIVRTHGTKATMPVYSAEMEIINNYFDAARKVFGNG